jgi:hypothetical protein
MSRVNVDVEAFHDFRFELLGKSLGLDKFSALGRMAMLWSFCTQRETYYVTRSIVDAITSCPGFCDAAVSVELLRNQDGKIYVCGTKGRIEWLRRLKQNSLKGGKATKRKHARIKASLGSKYAGPDDPGEDGQIVDQLTSQKPSAPTPAPAPALSPTPTIINKRRDAFANAPASLGNKIHQLEEEEGGEGKKAKGAEIKRKKTEGAGVFDYYSYQLKSKHGINASRGAKEYKLLNSMIAEFGVEKTKKLIDQYLNENKNEWYREEAFPIGVLYSKKQKFLADLEKAQRNDYEIVFTDSTLIEPPCDG